MAVLKYKDQSGNFISLPNNLIAPYVFESTHPYNASTNPAATVESITSRLTGSGFASNIAETIYAALEITPETGKEDDLTEAIEAAVAEALENAFASGTHSEAADDLNEAISNAVAKAVENALNTSGAETPELVTAIESVVETFLTDTNKFIAGSNVSITHNTANHTVTIAATDTTYNEATTNASGLMSAEDKTKLNGIASGATANVGTITGITMNGASKGTDGVVDLGSVATLGGDGKVPSNQLPSYVDDVVDLLNVTDTAPATCAEGDKYYNTLSKKIFTATGTNTWAAEGETPESGKIYINLNDNKTYRWSGSTLAVISETLALGETATTAYRGDRGKTAYDHSQAPHAPSNANNANISYNTSDKKITKSIDGTTSDVVTAATIVSDGGGITSHAKHKLTTTNGDASSVSQGTEITYIESLTGTTTATSGDLAVTATRKKITVPAAYIHPTGDGNSHVPTTGTTNSGKVLMAGSTANSASWQSLPAMGASGPNHKSGLVPDPGATQGTSRYLREDGSWQTPPDNNTTYTFAKGTTAGAFSVTPSGGNAQSVSIYGIPTTRETAVSGGTANSLVTTDDLFRIEYLTSRSTANSFTSVPITNNVCVITRSSATQQTLSLSNTLPSGRELHIIIVASGANAVVGIPFNGSTWFDCNEATTSTKTLTITSGKYGEINIINGGTTASPKYYVRYIGE